MTAEVVQQDVVRRLNKDFVQEDAAIIEDVAASCSYNYEESYKALALLFGNSSSASTLLSVVPTTEGPAVTESTKSTPEDQQTVPEMSATLSKDQSVPDGVSFAQVSGTGPKPNTGAIRKTNFVLKNNRKASKPSVNKNNVDKIKRMLMEKWNVLIILRGLPGSGKTYLSRELTSMASECGFIHQICSADLFFQKGNGQYFFNPQELQEAHRVSQQKARMALAQKVQLVIIDNTNIEEWEMKPYVEMGVQNAYHIELLEPLTEWKLNVGKLKEKNIHNVPDKSIKIKKDRYQPFSAQQLIDSFKLSKAHQKILPDSPVLSLEQRPAPTTTPVDQKELFADIDFKNIQVPIPAHEMDEKVQNIEAIEGGPALSDDEEEVIDYDGVPESAKEMYKKLPELFPNFDKVTVRHIFKDNHFDEEYFFAAMENSRKLLEKNSQVGNRPLVTPLMKEVKQPTATTFEMPHKRPATEMSAQAMELKRVIEEKVVIPKNKEKDRVVVSEEKDQVVVDRTRTESTSSSDSPDEFDAVLDRDFAKTLLLNYGGPVVLEDLEDDSLKLKIPADVACKIHSLWMEALQSHFNCRENNVQVQLDSDYALAQSLSMEDQIVQQPKPNMQDIIEMEEALAAVKKLQIGESKNDIATRMSRQKLFDEFPNMDRAAIEDIFETHNRDYNATSSAIKKVYQSESSAKNVYTPEALKLKEEELIEQAKQESLKSLQAETKKPLFVDVIPIRQRPTGEIDEAKMIEEITKYREQAKVALSGKITAVKQAEKSLEKKMQSVAGYYQEIAKNYDAQYASANSMVPSIVLQNASPEFLDLHYVYVSEALTILDLFLDFHAKRRQDDPTIGSEMVEIVTGRGKRSINGIAKIKPAVSRRLKKRGIKFEESNPGALRVYITKGLQFSSNYANCESDEDVE